MKESQVQKKLMDAIKEAFPHAKVRKIHQSMYSRNGILDLVCCINSKYVDIEVKKSMAEEPTKLQQLEMDATVDAGGVSLCCYGAAHIPRIISYLKATIG